MSVKCKRRPTGGLLGRAVRLARDQSGAAAVEFALWLVVLAYPLLNVADIGLYVYKSMQVSNASQRAVQSVFQSCGQVNATPIATSCATYNSSITSGAQTTSLGAGVSVTDKSECVAGVVKSGSKTNADCPSASGDYVAVTVSYPFTPLFGLASITSLLSTPIVRTHWIRML